MVKSTITIWNIPLPRRVFQSVILEPEDMIVPFSSSGHYLVCYYQYWLNSASARMLLIYYNKLLIREADENELKGTQSKLKQRKGISQQGFLQLVKQKLKFYFSLLFFFFVNPFISILPLTLPLLVVRLKIQTLNLTLEKTLRVFS